MAEKINYGFVEPIITEGERYAKGKKDQRRYHRCLECCVLFIGRPGQRGVSKWCRKCENVELVCKMCGKNYSVKRKFFMFRGSKLCGLGCYGAWRRRNYSGKNAPKWKGGYNRVIAYRARKRNATGTHTLEEWDELKRFYKFMCLCCKKFEPEIKLSEDHIVPLSLGGANDISNIQPLCLRCNQSKWAKIINYKECLTTA